MTIESCEACPKSEDCKVYQNFLAKGIDVEEVDTLVVMEFEERKRSEYYKLAKLLIEGAGIPEDRVAIVGAVKHRVDKDASAKEIAACRDILRKEIKAYDPKSLVVMGNIGLKSILDMTGINKVRGQIIEWGDRQVVPTFNVGMILYNPDNTGIMSDDFKRAYDVATSGLPDRRPTEYITIQTLDEWKELYYKLKSVDKFAFDIETNDTYESDSEGPNPYRDGAKILAISFCFEEAKAYCLPLWARKTPFDDEVLDEIILEDLKDLMEDERVKKVAHNGKFDCQYLQVNKGILVKNYWFDTMLAHHMIQEEKGTHSLKRLAWQFTDMGGYDLELDGEIAKLSGAEKNLDFVPLDIMTKYCAADADVTWRLLPVMLDLLEKEGQTDLMFDHVMKMHHALMRVEMNGVKPDIEFLEKMERDFPKKLDELYQRMRSYPEVLQIEERLNIKANIGRKTPAKPEYINFNSYQQVQDLLFDVMGLEPVKHTEKNKTWTPADGIRKASTDDDVLKELQKEHELIAVLMLYRKFTKFYGTYVKPVRRWIGPDGLIHTSYLIHGTVTYRLSSQRPNMQNIPRSGTSEVVGINYKNLFVPRKPGNLLMQADYSQMEMRVLAMFCKDAVLMEAFNAGEDLHKYAAYIVEGIPLAEVTKEQRQTYKTLQFGLVYCKGPRSMAEELHWYKKNGDPDIDKALKAQDRYFRRYKKVKPWIKQMQEFAKKNKHVQSLFGRKRRLPEVDSMEEWRAAEALRQAVNAPIQSTASDITMWSLYTIMEEMDRRKMESQIIITVHDSIVFDVPESELVELIELVAEVCNNPPFPWINVPIKVDIGIGYEWGTLEDIA